MATVWVGETAGMAEGLASTSRNRNGNGNGGKVVILAGSNTAIAAVRKDGKTGKARSRDLKEVVDEIGARPPRMVG